jgi:hypothetical protein
MLQEDPRIDGHIDCERNRAEEKLIATGEPFRIKDRKNILRDEISLIVRFSLLPAQPVFERRQGANPAGELDEHTPESRRNMNPDDAGPPDRQEPPEHDKDHECEMKEEEEVRCDRLFLQFDRGEQLIEIFLL